MSTSTICFKVSKDYRAHEEVQLKAYHLIDCAETWLFILPTTFPKPNWQELGGEAGLVDKALT